MCHPYIGVIRLWDIDYIYWSRGFREFVEFSVNSLRSLARGR